MQLTVTGRHESITDAVKDYASQKLTHIIDKYVSDRITKAHIIMDVQRYQQVVEMEVHGPQTDIYGKHESSDMYASIDKVIDKIERQLLKRKTKYKERKHGGSDTIRMPKVEEE